MYEHKAFLESWKDQWPLKITSDEGWLPDERASAVKAMLEKLNMQAELPMVPTDSVVTDESFFRKYLWFCIPIAAVVLFGSFFLRRVFSK